jgi:copper homeostasis protein CutC
MRSVSQGRAAEIAGVSRAELIDALGKYGVSPFQETADEIVESAQSHEDRESVLDELTAEAEKHGLV